MINLPTKLEVHPLEDMKVVEKCAKWDGLGWLGVTRVIGNVTIA